MSSINQELEIIQNAKDDLAETLITTFGVQAQDEVDASNNVTSEGLADSNGNLKRLREWAPLLEAHKLYWADLEISKEASTESTPTFKSVKLTDGTNDLNLYTTTEGGVPTTYFEALNEGRLYLSGSDNSLGQIILDSENIHPWSAGGFGNMGTTVNPWKYTYSNNVYTSRLASQNGTLWINGVINSNNPADNGIISNVYFKANNVCPGSKDPDNNLGTTSFPWKTLSTVEATIGRAASGYNLNSILKGVLKFQNTNNSYTTVSSSAIEDTDIDLAHFNDVHVKEATLDGYYPLTMVESSGDLPKYEALYTKTNIKYNPVQNILDTGRVHAHTYTYSEHPENASLVVYNSLDSGNQDSIYTSMRPRIGFVYHDNHVDDRYCGQIVMDKSGFTFYRGSSDNSKNADGSWKGTNDSVYKASNGGIPYAEVKAGNAQVYRDNAFRNVLTDYEVLEEGEGYDANGHEYVDLGLPSGTLWATENVSSNGVEHFAWGDPQEKSIFSWDTYPDGDGTNFTKYKVDGKTELDLEDDPANIYFGGGWRTPSKKQLLELKNNCTWIWTNRNGKNGCLFTSESNGNSIFLPAAGFRDGGSLYYADSMGYYWSRSLSTSYSDYVDNLNFTSGVVVLSLNMRYIGRSVRPVLEKSTKKKIKPELLNDYATKEELNALDLSIFKMVSALPTDNIDENKIYLIPSTETEEGNIYTEYAYKNNAWEKLGEYKSDVDLSEYAKKSDIKEYNPTVTNPTNLKEYNLLFCDGASPYASHYTNNRLKFSEGLDGNILTIGNESKYGQLRVYNSDNTFAQYSSTGISFANGWISILGPSSTTANEHKWTTLAIGNGNSYTSTNPHQSGTLRLYGPTSGSHAIYPQASETSYNHYLPNTSLQDSYLVSSTLGAAVGSSTQPVYINALGEATACTSVNADTVDGVHYDPVFNTFYKHTAEYTKENATSDDWLVRIDLDSNWNNSMCELVVHPNYNNIFGALKISRNDEIMVSQYNGNNALEYFGQWLNGDGIHIYLKLAKNALTNNGIYGVEGHVKVYASYPITITEITELPSNITLKSIGIRNSNGNNLISKSFLSDDGVTARRFLPNNEGLTYSGLASLGTPWMHWPAVYAEYLSSDNSDWSVNLLKVPNKSGTLATLDDIPSTSNFLTKTAQTLTDAEKTLVKENLGIGAEPVLPNYHLNDLTPVTNSLNGVTCDGYAFESDTNEYTISVELGGMTYDKCKDITLKQFIQYDYKVFELIGGDYNLFKVIIVGYSMFNLDTNKYGNVFHCLMSLELSQGGSWYLANVSDLQIHNFMYYYNIINCLQLCNTSDFITVLIPHTVTSRVDNGILRRIRSNTATSWENITDIRLTTFYNSDEEIHVFTIDSGGLNSCYINSSYKIVGDMEFEAGETYVMCIKAGVITKQKIS